MTAFIGYHPRPTRQAGERILLITAVGSMLLVVALIMVLLTGGVASGASPAVLLGLWPPG